MHIAGGSAVSCKATVEADVDRNDTSFVSAHVSEPGRWHPGIDMIWREHTNLQDN